MLRYFYCKADLFPEEGIKLWKNGMPALSTLRSMSIGIMLGNKGESYVDWYLQPDYQTLLLGRLRQQLDKIAQIVLHFSISVCNVHLSVIFLTLQWCLVTCIISTGLGCCTRYASSFYSSNCMQDSWIYYWSTPCDSFMAAQSSCWKSPFWWWYL